MRTSFRLPMTAATTVLAACLATTAPAQTFTMKFGTATVNVKRFGTLDIWAAGGVTNTVNYAPGSIERRRARRMRKRR